MPASNSADFSDLSLLKDASKSSSKKQGRSKKSASADKTSGTPITTPTTTGESAVTRQVNQSTSSFFPPPPASQSPSRTHRATPVAPPTPIPHSNTIPSVAPAPTAAPGLSSKFKLSRSIKAVPSPQAQPGAVVDPVRDGQTTSPFSAIATTTTITGLKDLKNPAQTSSNTMLPPPARISRSTSKEVNRSIHHSNTIETMGRTIHTATNATDNEASGNEIEGAFKKPTGRPRSASRSISKEKHRVQDEERDSSDGRNNERFDQLPQRGINYQEFNPIGIDTTTGYNHERDQFGTSQFEDPLTQLGKNNNNNNHNDQQETGGMSSQQRQDELDDDLNALNNDTEMIGGRGEKRGRDYDHGRNDDDRDNRDQESLNQEDDGGNSRGKEKRMRSQALGLQGEDHDQAQHHDHHQQEQYYYTDQFQSLDEGYSDSHSARYQTHHHHQQPGSPEYSEHQPPQNQSSPLASISERFPGPQPHLQEAMALTARYSIKLENEPNGNGKGGNSTDWANCSVEEWSKAGEDLRERFGECVKKVGELVEKKAQRLATYQARLEAHSNELVDRQTKIDGTFASLRAWAGEIWRGT